MTVPNATRSRMIPSMILSTPPCTRTMSFCHRTSASAALRALFSWLTARLCFHERTSAWMGVSVTGATARVLLFCVCIRLRGCRYAGFPLSAAVCLSGDVRLPNEDGLPDGACRGIPPPCAFRSLRGFGCCVRWMAAGSRAGLPYVGFLAGCVAWDMPDLLRTV